MEKLVWQTKKVKVKDLVCLEINPRKITEEKKQKLIESLEKFNLVEIPAVNTDNKIIGGNQRVTALILAGRGDDEIDVRYPNRELTEKEIKEYVIISNTHAGEFDFEMLELEFGDIELSEIGFDIAGLDEWNIKQEKILTQEAEEDDYQVPEGGKDTDIVLGDLFEIGEHRLLCGDSTDSDAVAKLMNGEKADMVFTDPPYNVAFNGRSGKFDVIENDDLPENEFEDLIDGFVSILEILNPNNYYVWCNWKFYGLLQSKLEFKACIVWAKNVFGLGRGYRHQHEFCLFNGKLDDGINNESDLWELAKDTNYQHPTQKPITLASRALNNHKKDINIVDLFCGSGSTMVASHQLKRKCYGMELDPKYCQVIVERMAKLDPSLEILRNGEKWSTPKNS
jgi:DNA modification methylase